DLADDGDVPGRVAVGADRRRLHERDGAGEARGGGDGGAVLEHADGAQAVVLDGAEAGEEKVVGDGDGAVGAGIELSAGINVNRSAAKDAGHRLRDAAGVDVRAAAVGVGGVVDRDVPAVHA